MGSSKNFSQIFGTILIGGILFIIGRETRGGNDNPCYFSAYAANIGGTIPTLTKKVGLNLAQVENLKELDIIGTEIRNKQQEQRKLMTETIVQNIRNEKFSVSQITEMEKKSDPYFSAADQKFINTLDSFLKSLDASQRNRLDVQLESYFKNCKS